MVSPNVIARWLIPRATPHTTARAKPAEWAIIAALVLIGLIAHGFNMFNYPAFTFNGDEGIYTGQALAVLRLGQLAPYTYFYDHAPAGWIMLAAWMALSGGPHTFGSAIDGGRVLMLLLHLAIVHRLYRVARELGCGRSAAALAALLFALSPLTIFYGRPVMLDSIMLFWLLISLDLLLDGQGRLSRVALSGACFGIALLTKETAIFLLPAMLLLAVQERRQHHGRFAVLGWALPKVIVTSWYLLYAVLKGELLPPGLLGDDRLLRDPMIIVAGVGAVALNLIRGIRDRMALVVGLLGLLSLYYLARGGLVFNFYILFALPFFALNIGALFAVLFGRMRPWATGAMVLAIVGALLLNWWSIGMLDPLYRARSGQAGHAAITWIRANLPPDSMIIADDAFWPDLRVPPSGEPVFPNIHSHWKVGQDPEIGDGVFHNDWRTVDYLIMTPGLERNFSGTTYPVALEALRHAHPIQRWTAERTTVEL